MRILAPWQCKHPLQPAGGVCSVCLKDRLSKINGCNKASARRTDVERQSPKNHHADSDAVAVIVHEGTTALEDIAEVGQSIGCLIKREINEGFQRRFSDATSPGSRVRPDSMQFLRSKSTSQLDVYSSVDGKSICDRPQSRNGRMSLKVKQMQDSISSFATTLQTKIGRAFSPPYHNGDGYQKTSFEFEGTTTELQLTKAKLTYQLHSPANLWAWNKTPKTSETPSAHVEKSAAPLMMPRCKTKDRGIGDVKATGNVWIPLRMLFRWRRRPRNSSSNQSADSSSTPWSTSSTTSSCMQFPSSVEQKRHCDITAPRANVACAASSSFSSAPPLLASFVDTAMACSDCKTKLDHKYVQSIAALIAIDAKTSAPLKMAC